MALVFSVLPSAGMFIGAKNCMHPFAAFMLALVFLVLLTWYLLSMPNQAEDADEDR